MSLTGPNAGNYVVVYSGGTFTVNKAPLTVNAPSASVHEGSVPSSFTPTYTGLANGQTAPATPATCTSTATNSSPAGVYPITCSGASDSNYAITYGPPGTLTVEGPPINCAAEGVHQITGYQGQPFSLSGAGSWCINNAQLSAPVSISNGANVLIQHSTISSTVNANGGGIFALCGSTVYSTVTVKNAQGFVLIGDPTDDLCATNHIFGPITLQSNSHAVEVHGNTFYAPLTVNGSTGTGPFAEDQGAEIEGNSSYSNLACSANSPITNDGQPNHVSGLRSGQCSSPTF